MRSILIASLFALAPALAHGADRPPPVRDSAELRDTLWRTLDYAGKGNSIDLKTNMDFRRFLLSRNSATPTEVLKARQASGDPIPDHFQLGEYTLGDRVQVTTGWMHNRVEEHTGIVIMLKRGPSGAVEPSFYVDGKDGGSPFYVHMPASPGAWWLPQSASARVTASAPMSPQEELRAQDFKQTWGNMAMNRSSSILDYDDGRLAASLKLGRLDDDLSIEAKKHLIPAVAAKHPLIVTRVVTKVWQTDKMVNLRNFELRVGNKVIPVSEELYLRLLSEAPPAPEQ